MRSDFAATVNVGDDGNDSDVSGYASLVALVAEGCHGPTHIVESSCVCDGGMDGRGSVVPPDGLGMDRLVVDDGDMHVPLAMGRIMRTRNGRHGISMGTP
jgi:hypothetical protein